ncbi:hypothetical protein AWB78_08382 [Caballeronia calidae]|uniref:Uncharacterized protein n=1 Tax=Caballeronia calidae TaxID=1777139 RepID=A0A158EKY0_9BURK|nr:hypothetical protein AWB78_08382 [Caballeronia calidae]
MRGRPRRGPPDRAGGRNSAVSIRAWPMTCMFRRSNGRTRRARMNQESNSTRMGRSVTPETARTSASAILSLLVLPVSGTSRERIGSTMPTPPLPSTLTPRVTMHCAQTCLGRLVLPLCSRRHATARRPLRAAHDQRIVQDHGERAAGQDDKHQSQQRSREWHRTPGATLQKLEICRPVARTPNGRDCATHPSFGRNHAPAQQLEKAGLGAKRHGGKQNVDPFAQVKLSAFRQ